MNLDNLPNAFGYFMEWGGASWNSLARHGLEHCLGLDSIAGQDVLEIGCRHGRMSSLFALLGARVTGVDMNEAALQQARDEARRWDVQDLTEFKPCSATLDEIPESSVDIIFCKSVLVVVPDLSEYMDTLRRKLRAGGRVLFLENAAGLPGMSLIRRVRHRRWCKRVKASYFDSARCRMVGSGFDAFCIRRTWLPPVCMMYGRMSAGA